MDDEKWVYALEWAMVMCEKDLKYRRAIRYGWLALFVDPKNPNILHLMATCYWELNMQIRAIALFKCNMHKNPHYSNTPHSLMRCYGLLKKPRKVVKYARLLEKIGNDDEKKEAIAAIRAINGA
jgi:tetratricopeptide (TPR) repeat protein